MTAVQVGEIYKMNYPNEGVDRWFRFCIVSISDDGRTAWVKSADHSGNSFPCWSSDLHPTD